MRVSTLEVPTSSVGAALTVPEITSGRILSWITDPQSTNQNAGHKIRGKGHGTPPVPPARESTPLARSAPVADGVRPDRAWQNPRSFSLNLYGELSFEPEKFARPSMMKDIDP